MQERSHGCVLYSARRTEAASRFAACALARPQLVKGRVGERTKATQRQII
jgi:hypothetical protein